MKLNKIIVASILTLTAGAAQAASPAITAPGGTVHFRGDIVNAACAVSPKSADQIVQLGQYRTANFKAVGDKSNTIPFTINLQDCDSTVAAAAMVSFSGSVDDTDATVLSVSNIRDGGVSGAASGVGIEIADQQGKVLTPNTGTFSAPKTLNDGDNVLNFTARYKSTLAAVTPGRADADATFTMQYE